MRVRSRGRLGAAAAVLLMVIACGDADDGASVRNIDGNGPGSASGSGSGSASGTGSGSGSASGTGSGSAASGTGAVGASGAAFGGFEPVSDVSAHARVSLDVCAVKDGLSDGAIDQDAVRSAYVEGGNSLNSDGSIRTLAGFATAEHDEAIWNDYVDYFGDATWLDTWVASAIDGADQFAQMSDGVRRQAIEKGTQNQIMVAWALHELVAAAEKVDAGETGQTEGAPHNVDEFWAFYHGDNPDCAPYATADKRGEDFGTGTAVNEAILSQAQAAQQAAVDGDAQALADATDEIVRQLTVTYLQASIKYATTAAAAAEGDDEEARVQQAEGASFFRVVAPLVAQADPDAADQIAGVFDLEEGPDTEGGDRVRQALESVYEPLGITPEQIGTFSG